MAQDKLKQETKAQMIERQLLREKKQLAKEELKRRKDQERAQKKTNATRKSSNKAKGKNGNTKCPSAKDGDVASYLLPMAVNIPDARQRYFHHLQATLLACPSWEGISQVIPDELRYVLDVNPTPIASLLQQDTDVISKRLLCGDVETKHLQPIRIYGDGNCLPRTVSMYLSGEQNMHVEIRVRMAMELIKHPETYLQDGYLSLGVGDGKRKVGIAKQYAQYSDQYGHGTQNILSQTDVQNIFRAEVTDVIKNGSFCGMWLLHAVASLLQRPVHSIYPGLGPPKADLNRIIMPREPLKQAKLSAISIMWTSTHDNNIKSWWQPNHFVLVVDPDHSHGDIEMYSCHGINSNQGMNSAIPEIIPEKYCYVYAQLFSDSKLDRGSVGVRRLSGNIIVYIQEHFYHKTTDVRLSIAPPWSVIGLFKASSRRSRRYFREKY